MAGQSLLHVLEQGLGHVQIVVLSGAVGRAAGRKDAEAAVVVIVGVEFVVEG